MTDLSDLLSQYGAAFDDADSTTYDRIATEAAALLPTIERRFGRLSEAVSGEIMSAVDDVEGDLVGILSAITTADADRYVDTWSPSREQSFDDSFDLIQREARSVCAVDVPSLFD